jgi:hypothetical protein
VEEHNRRTDDRDLRTTHETVDKVMRGEEQIIQLREDTADEALGDLGEVSATVLRRRDAEAVRLLRRSAEADEATE